MLMNPESGWLKKEKAYQTLLFVPSPLPPLQLPYLVCHVDWEYTLVELRVIFLRLWPVSRSLCHYIVKVVHIADEHRFPTH